MTEKRFNSYCDNENIRIRIDDDIKNKEVFHIYFAELDDALYCKSKLNSILDLLNALHEENQSLKQSFDLINKVRKELIEENEQLQFENNELKCALALDAVDYIIADGKKIDIPPYYEFEQRYDCVMHRREYDGYD